MGMDPLTWQHNEIFRGIVEAVSVFMVNHFPRKKGTTQSLLCQPAVFQHSLPRMRIADIRVDLTLSDGLSSSPLLDFQALCGATNVVSDGKKASLIHFLTISLKN